MVLQRKLPSNCLLYFPSYLTLQVISIPEYAGQSCLILNNTLSAIELAGCSRITLRAYGTFGHDRGYLAGANTMDISKIGLDQGLRAQNITLIADAFRRIHELIVQRNTTADGIQPDGSFTQHGIIYNGNYGRD